MNAAAQFDAIVDEYLLRFFAQNPIGATAVGIHDHDNELGDYSAAGFEQRLQTDEQTLKRLQTDLKPADLDPRRDTDYRLFTHHLEADIRLAKARPEWRLQPSSYAWAAYGGVHLLMLRDHAPLAVRVAQMASRLRQVPAALEEARRNLDNPPRLWTETALESLAGGVGFIESLPALLGPQAPQAADALDRGVAEAVAALRGYGEFLKDELLPRSTGDFALGAALFDYRLTHEHFLPWTGADLIGIGERVFGETVAEMEAVAARLDKSRPWTAILDDLKNDHPTREQVMPEYIGAMARAKDFVRANDLATLPEDDALELIDTPAFLRPIIPYGAYMWPAPFEQKQKGYFYVTPVSGDLDAVETKERLRGHNRGHMALVALHEAYPGHHLQLVRSNGHASKLRKVIHSTVFAEGWALYCEEMMHEVGYYPNDGVRLLQLRDQLWRAGRVVVDVKLHSGAMGFDEAVDFMQQRCHIERPNAIAEVKRYTQSPTQPMSYIIGKLLIQEIRRTAERARGAGFSLKAFHDDLLSHGTIPPALVAERMQ